MKDAIRIFKRFLPPYKGLIGLNVSFNLMGAIFNLFSIVALIPVLEILFTPNIEKQHTIQEISFSAMSFSELREALNNNLYAFIQGWAINEGPFKVLVAVGILYIIMVLFKTAFYFFGSLTMVHMRNNVVRDIRNILYTKIVALPIGFFTEEKKGDIISRFTGDVSEVENSIMTSLDMFFKNPIIILITVIAMFVWSWQLTLFVFVLFPIAGSVIGIVGKKLKSDSLQAQNKMGEILSTLEESLSGLRIIKAFNAEPFMSKHQKKENHDYRRIMNRVMARKSLASPLSEFMGTIIVIAVLTFGGHLILNNTGSSLKPSMFIAYIGLFYSIIQPTKSFATAFYNVQKGMASMDRIDKIIFTHNPITNKVNPESISTLDNKLEYQDVSFRYGEEYVLQDIALSIPKGKSIALVGQSGSGKSTMVDLLPRFYDVEKGGIYIDGKNIKDLEISKLRSLFGIVNQEPILFNDTIFNNIAFGVNDIGEEEVIRAAKIANAHEFIMATENGYQTGIGDRGSKLSGGQRQRLSIARAILKNPAILILDEATSSLDTESERLVQEAIDNLMKDRTSIVIAHRLSTIRNVDEIYVLDKGRIIEKGGYQELLKLNGEFKKLHDNQFE